MYLEFFRHSKNSTALSKQHKEMESQDMKETPSLKSNTISNEKILVSILKLARKRKTNPKILASFFIMETTIGRIFSTILTAGNTGAKQGTRYRRRERI